MKNSKEILAEFCLDLFHGLISFPKGHSLEMGEINISEIERKLVNINDIHKKRIDRFLEWEFILFKEAVNSKNLDALSNWVIHYPIEFNELLDRCLKLKERINEHE